MPSRSPAIRPRPRTGRCRRSSSAPQACCRRPSASRSASSMSAISSRTSTRRWKRPARPRDFRPRSRRFTAMSILIDRDQGISSPALVPAEADLARDHGGAELTIGLVNNMPDPALKATERQFMKLLQAAAGPRRIRFHCFSLPSVKRSPEARWHVESEYSELTELRRHKFDGLIVTGAEPVAPELDQEPYWRDLTELIDWAKVNTRSTIWSCLAAHAAVLHLDGIARRQLPA